MSSFLLTKTYLQVSLDLKASFDVVETALIEKHDCLLTVHFISSCVTVLNLYKYHYPSFFRKTVNILAVDRFLAPK